MRSALLAFVIVASAATVPASRTISLPGAPFAVTTSRDGRWVFVSLMGKNSGIAVLSQSEGRAELVRMVPLKKQPAGIVITHDGKLLIAAALDSVVLLDVDRMTSGHGNAVLTSFSEGRSSRSVNVNVTADDKLLFVSEESAHAITVIDLERVRSKGYDAGALIGKIPVGASPIALIFSSDDRWLYTTSQAAMPDWNWPKACTPEGRDPSKTEVARPEGAIVVVDVNRARTDPSQSVVARVPAGCSPVRLAISPQGDRVYVAARNSNAVLAFDGAKLVSDSAHARIGMAAVGSAPVPVAVVNGGNRVIAGNSNRFGGATAASTLTILDAARIGSSTNAAMGTIPTGAFPRDLCVSSDGRTLFVANFGSKSLQVIDLDHLP